MFTLIVHRTARKSLERLPKKQRQNILAAIDTLLADPFLGKKLEGEYEGQYTLRVGTYRVLYEIHRKQVLVVVLTVGHRQGIYK